MKKILLVVSLISVLLLAGCNKNEEVNNNVNNSITDVVTENLTDNKSTIKGNDDGDKKGENPYFKFTQDDFRLFLNNYASSIDYIVSDKDSALLDNDKYVLIIKRNIPFALKGHDFRDANLKEFFESFEWYEPINDKTVSFDDLNSNEQKAVKIIDDKIAEIEEVELTVPKYEYDDKKDIVYTFYSKINKEVSGRKFEFPYINIDNQDIKNINDEIYKWAMPIILGTAFDCSGVDYYYYVVNDILTIIIQAENGYGGDSGFYYNIDTKTGKIIDNRQILATHSIKESEIKKDSILNATIFKTNNVFSSLNEYLDAYEKSNPNGDKKSIIDDITNIEKWNLIYFDNDNKMHIVVELPNLAGASGVSEFYDCIVEY